MTERLTLRNLYLYLVCLITLLVALFATVSLVRNAVQLLYPDPLAYPGYVSPYSPASAGQTAQVARDSQRQHAVLGLVGAGTTLLIAGPLYAYHWRRVQSEFRSATASP